MKLLIIPICFLFVFNILNAQTDSLGHYTLSQLDSLYQTKKKPQEQLPYALALLQKGEKELDTKDTAYAKLLFYVGNTYQKLRNWSNATSYLEQSITIWQLKMPMHVAHSNCLNSLGAVYYYQRQNETTEKYWQQALTIQKEVLGDNHPDYAKSLNNLAILYNDMGNYALAEPLYQKALKIKKEALGDNHPEYAASLNNLGIFYKNVGKYALTEPLYQEALKIRKEVLGNKHPDYASSLNNLAILYSEMGNYPLAEPLHQEALKIRKEVLGNKHPDYAGSLSNLASLYIGMGNYALAKPLYQEALIIRKEVLGYKHPQYANSLNGLAFLYKNMGSYALAEPLYQEVLKIQKEVLGNKHPSYAQSLSSLANLYSDMGNNVLADSLYQEALKIQKEVLGDKHPDYAQSLNDLAVLYYDMGNYNLAMPLYQEALKIRKEVLGDKHPEYAGSLNNLAILYIVMGNAALAEPLFQEALKIRKEVLGDKHPSYAVSLNSLANFYMDIGKYTLAEPLYQEALKIYKEVLGDKHLDYAGSLINLANLYKKMANDAKAEPFYLEAKSIFESQNLIRNPFYMNCLISLALLYKDIGEYTKAESYFNQCFAVKNANLSTNFSWLPEKGKAAYWQQEKIFYEELNNYAAQASSSFPKAAELGYNNNLIAKGLLLESTKEVEEAALASKDSMTIQIFETLREKRRLINHLVSSGTGKKEILVQLETEADSLDKILVNRLGDYAAAKRKFQITWKEVQNALAENEAAIEFARFYNEKDSQYYYMALLLRNGYELPKLIKLGAEKAIAAIPSGKGFADLYKLIWEPIDSLLAGVETVYYSPDGVLNNISFAALCSKGTEQVISTKEVKRGGIGKTSSKTSECNYLSDKYTLHQLSITRYLAEGLKTSKVDNSMLVFGGVNYDEIPATGDTIAEVQFLEIDDYALAENIARSSNNQSRMEYLPGTQTELQNVQKIMHKKQWKIRAFSDKNASENTLKTEIQKESPSMLHIATHGFAFPDIEEKKTDNKTYRDADNPMARCGLLFAGANHSWTGDSKMVLSQTGEDGILTALEVSNLPLKNTKLVVLSACETGLGKIQGTEGVFGLKRGFKLALVEQIIVSLWSVPDKETMELMDIFYNDLAKTRNAVISFEKAQKEMRKKYADRPDLWAGFVLVR